MPLPYHPKGVRVHENGATHRPSFGVYPMRSDTGRSKDNGRLKQTGLPVAGFHGMPRAPNR